MRLREIILTNFRAYGQGVRIAVDDFTVLIGRNDIGKSCVLEALDVFFNGAEIELPDLNVAAAEHVIRIGCIFDNLPEELVLDADAPTSLDRERLLNHDGHLEVWKEFDCGGGRVKKAVVLALAEHPMADGVGDLLQLKNSDLRARLETLGVDPGAVDRRSNPDMRRAIWGAAADLSIGTTKVPLDKEDAKRIWDRLQDRLPLFALFKADRASLDEDSEFQEPMKFAIKEGLANAQAALGEVQNAVRDAALETARRTLAKLHDLDTSLADDLTPSFRTDPKWEQIFKLSLQAGGGIPMNKRGSGVRRLILLSFFRAEAEKRLSEAETSDGIIYAIEEPETSQHPSYQKLLIRALLNLASSGTQVIATTHNPAIASLVPVDSVRHIKKSANELVVDSGTEQVWGEIADELGVLPDSRIKAIVCVEGGNDLTALGHFSQLLHQADDTVPSLRALSSVAAIPLGGSNLRQWVDQHYLSGLRKPEAHFYDRDGETPPKYQSQSDAVNARGDRSFAHITTKRELENYLHSDAIRAVLGCSVTFGADDDVPEVVAQTLHANNGGPTPWAALTAEQKADKVKRAKRALNDRVAGAMTIDQLRAQDTGGEIENWLRRLGALIT